MLLPLVASERFVEISDDLIGGSLEMAEGVGRIGIGIGAIMLLIVVIYYIITILDGGKFQMKMLIPLLLFLCVCNFGWVARPVVQFTTTLSRSITEVLMDKKHDLLNPQGSEGISTVNDHYVSTHLEDDPTSGEGKDEELEENEQGDEAGTTVADAKWKSMMKSAWKGITRLSAIRLISEFAVSANSSTAENLTSERLSFSGILCSVMSWICSGVSFCLKIFGIMMTSVVVVFGPISFAFAIIPGRGANVVSWFIRICQFALFGPLCAFIDAFTVSAYLLLDSSAGNAMGFLMVFAITLANLVGLVSVPTIASMIIEGASGAVSLSQGLQTISGAAMATGGMVVSGTVGQANSFNNFMNGFKHKGLVGFIGDVNQNGFKKAVMDTAKYGQGALYGWNVQDQPGNPDPNNP